MNRTHRIHPPAEAARTTSVIATTSAPHLLTPHARATREIAHARERSDSSSGEPAPPANGTWPHPPLTQHTRPHPRSKTMTIRRTLLAALAATALIAPAAQAQPADMHASTAQAAAKAQHQPKQDLRSPDARDATGTLRHSGPAVNAPGATALGSASQLPPAGQPTWPVNPAPIAPPVQEPVDNGSPVPVIPLVAALLGVVLAASAARYGVRRAQRRTRIAL